MCYVSIDDYDLITLMRFSTNSDLTRAICSNRFKREDKQNVAALGSVCLQAADKIRTSKGNLRKGSAGKERRRGGSDYEFVIRTI